MLLKLTEWTQNVLQNFSIMDIAMMKIYLVSVGVVLGTYFATFFKQMMVSVLFILAFSAIWMVVAIFF